MQVFSSLFLAGPGLAQGFNIDINYPTDPPLGGGAPNSTFGGAANQQGMWVALLWSGRGPTQLQSLNGALTPVTVTLDTHGLGIFGGGYNNALNTGDYALLLNDVISVGAVGPGGHLTYHFEHLTAGDYDIYTYAVSPIASSFTSVPVTIPEASGPQTLIVAGSMPGNSFIEGRTHSVHRVALVDDDSFHIDVVQPPMTPFGYYLNGFQIVPVPEPSTITSSAILIALMMVHRKKR